MGGTSTVMGLMCDLNSAFPTKIAFDIGVRWSDKKVKMYIILEMRYCHLQ